MKRSVAENLREKFDLYKAGKIPVTEYLEHLQNAVESLLESDTKVEKEVKTLRDFYRTKVGGSD